MPDLAKIHPRPTMVRGMTEYNPNIPKREPTTEERIKFRLQRISKKTGVPGGFSYNKMHNGYRLETPGGHEISKRYQAKVFLDIVTIIDDVLDEMVKHDSAEDKSQ